jgi:hypothetical protein
MTGELEQRLTALGTRLELPPTPDLVPAVLARLPARPRRRRRLTRTLALALASLLLLAGVAMAVPSTRHAILRVLGINGVRIERVPRLPPLPPGTASRLGLGTPIRLARARHAASFTALLPPGSPAAYLRHDIPGGRVSLLLGRVLIVEFRGTSTPFIFKVIGPGTRLEHIRVRGHPGFYLSGRLHEVLFQTQTGEIRADYVRLAGNVLMWQEGPLTIRIEGTRTLAQALALARSLR